MSYSDSVIQAESSGDPNAANPNSSALGLGQFITPTWVSLIKEHRPDLAQGKSDTEIAAMRTDPALSRQMIDAYASDNGAILSKAGLPVTPGSQYLAHFAGPQGAVKVLQADPSAPVESVLGAAAVKANPFLKGMTAQGLQAWASKKAGVSTPLDAPPQQTAAAPTAQPAQGQQQPAGFTLPQLNSPIFAAAAQGAPQMPTAAPPAFAQRPQIDLSGLRAALAQYQQQPIFART